MTIKEMHSTFRTLGQQMGMQLIRGILPESIDVYINDAINQKVRNVVVTNTNTQFNDRVAIQDNSISPINSLRNITKTKDIIVATTSPIESYKIDIPFKDEVMYYTSFGVYYNNIIRRRGTRFVESDKIDDILDDYCNNASWDYPIISMFADENNNEYLELYTNSNSKIVNKVQVRYIETPAIVKWSDDDNIAINCNLPKYLHPEIVKIAVSMFFESVNKTNKQVSN